jgi:hypothetical protein
VPAAHPKRESASPTSIYLITGFKRCEPSSRKIGA